MYVEHTAAAARTTTQPLDPRGAPSRRSVDAYRQVVGCVVVSLQMTSVWR